MCAICLHHVQLTPSTHITSDGHERKDMIAADRWHVANRCALRSSCHAIPGEPAALR
jgi:hypothetical protein